MASTGTDVAAPAALVVTRGREHDVELLTPAAAALLAVSAGPGRPLPELLGAAAPAGLPALLDRCYVTGDPASLALPGGGVVSCTPLRTPAGAVTGLALQALGVADRELAAAEAARSRSAALLRLAEALSSAATPSAIGELAVTQAADLLAADAANAF